MDDPTPTSETSFFSSLILLVVALVVTFGVLVVYAPSQRSVPASSASDEGLVASDMVDPAAGREADEAGMKHVAPGAFTTAKDPGGDVRPPKSEGGTPPAKTEASGSGKDTEALLSEAMSLVDAGNVQAALSILEKILRDDGNNELALVEMGMIQLIDLKDAQAAAGYLERALKVNPNNKVVLSELVGVYDETGHVDAGLGFLQNLYDENPDNAGLAMGIGQVLASQDRVQEALPFLEKAAEEGSSESLTDLADAYSQVGQGDKAVETYKKVADSAREKFESGFYANDPEIGRETVARAYMDLVAELHSQRDEAGLQEVERQMEKLLGGNLGELAALFGRNPPPRDSSSRN